MRAIVLAVLFACACGAASVPERRIAVLGVERSSGAQDEAVRAWLARHVDTHFEVVRSAPPEDGVDSLDEDAIRAEATRLGVEAIVYGELSKKKRGKTRLTVRVHDGRTGALIETHEVAFKGGKVIDKDERRFARELLALLPPRQSRPEVAKTKAKKKKHREPPPDDREPADDTPPVDTAPEIASDDRDNDREPAERTFVPATNLKSVELDRHGQADDEEMPALFVKK